MNDQRSTTYFTVRQAADLFKVSPQTIRRAIGSGRLEAIRLGPQTVRVRLPPGGRTPDPAGETPFDGGSTPTT
jgi:excisionase family DNA binding protein